MHPVIHSPLHWKFIYWKSESWKFFSLTKNLWRIYGQLWPEFVFNCFHNFPFEFSSIYIKKCILLMNFTIRCTFDIIIQNTSRLISNISRRENWFSSFLVLTILHDHQRVFCCVISRSVKCLAIQRVNLFDFITMLERIFPRAIIVATINSSSIGYHRRYCDFFRVLSGWSLSFSWYCLAGINVRETIYYLDFWQSDDDVDQW